MEMIVQLIGSLGFPIAMCIYLVVYNNKLNEMHKEEMDTLKDALVNNTLAIQHLTDIMTGGTANDEEV